MAKAEIIYTEKSFLYAKYDHPGSQDYLEYESIIEIKDAGKEPITTKLKFCGTVPYAAPMPPNTHTIKAESIHSLHVKIARWLNKFGYKVR